MIDKIDPERIKDFEKVLKDEVGDFLGLTKTGERMRHLDHKINVSQKEIEYDFDY